jgi:hypothetical protein
MIVEFGYSNLPKIYIFIIGHGRFSYKHQDFVVIRMTGNSDWQIMYRVLGFSLSTCSNAKQVIKIDKNFHMYRKIIPQFGLE